jgi:hypothetical protein
LSFNYLYKNSKEGVLTLFKNTGTLDRPDPTTALFKSILVDLFGSKLMTNRRTNVIGMNSHQNASHTHYGSTPERQVSGWETVRTLEKLWLVVSMIQGDRKVTQPVPDTCSTCRKINYTEIRKQKAMLC